MGPGGVQMPLGEGGDGGQVAKVQRIEPHLGAGMPGADQPFGLGALDRIAGGQNDLRALARQHQGGFQPQPAGRAGDDGQLAGLIGDVVGGPLGHDAILQRNGWIVKGFGPAHRLVRASGRCDRRGGRRCTHPPSSSPLWRGFIRPVCPQNARRRTPGVWSPGTSPGMTGLIRPPGWSLPGPTSAAPASGRRGFRPGVSAAHGTARP